MLEVALRGALLHVLGASLKHKKLPELCGAVSPRYILVLPRRFLPRLVVAVTEQAGNGHVPASAS